MTPRAPTHLTTPAWDDPPRRARVGTRGLPRSIACTAVAITVMVLGYAVGRWGVDLSQAGTGGTAALTASASILVAVWGLFLGFGFTAAATAFHLSPLPSDWKVWVASRAARRNWPWLPVLLLGGVVPFAVLFSIPDYTTAAVSPVTPWLIASGVIELVIATFLAVGVSRIYLALEPVQAIRTTLGTLGHRELELLRVIHQRTYSQEFEMGKGQAILPMSIYSTSPEVSRVPEHRLLVALFSYLFGQRDPQLLESGIFEVAEWAKSRSLKPIDSYLEYRVLPLCLVELLVTSHSEAPAAYGVRVYHFARLLNILGKSGATLSCSNGARSLWEGINQQANVYGLSETLTQARIGLQVLLAGDKARGESYSPYRVAMQSTFGKERAFFLDTPGDWERFVKEVLKNC